jgi:hypothetical protein
LSFAAIRVVVVIALLVVIKTVPHVHHVRVPQEFHNRQLPVFKSLILQNFFNRHGLVRRRAQRFVHDAERAVPDDALRFVTVVWKRKRERREKKDVRGQRYVIRLFFYRRSIKFTALF